MRSLLRGRLTVVVVAAIAALVAGGVAAYATIPDGNGVYTACVLKGIGTLRLVDPSLPHSNFASHCTQLEQQITWNQTGPTGPAGATGRPGATGPTGTTGPQGPSGTAGLSDYSNSTGSIDIGGFDFSDTESVDVWCHAGDIATGGGFYRDNADINYSDPTYGDGVEGWYVEAYTGAFASGHFGAYVKCLHVG
jgi:hypothetical protein